MAPIQPQNHVYMIKYRNEKHHTIRKYVSAPYEAAAMDIFYSRFGRKQILSCTRYI